jgi:hypothetical protein
VSFRLLYLNLRPALRLAVLLASVQERRTAQSCDTKSLQRITGPSGTSLMS